MNKVQETNVELDEEGAEVDAVDGEVAPGNSGGIVLE